MLGNTYVVSESLTAVLVKSSVFRAWHSLGLLTGTNISEANTVSIFNVLQKKCGILIFSLDYPDDGGRKFFQNLRKY